MTLAMMSSKESSDSEELSEEGVVSELFERLRNRTREFCAGTRRDKAFSLG